eukprot:TRINITY_DN39388_c0_g1_i1.p1 TRINITY_DN39388_c0_g1~~TRINITY_DN39388_c0_g1_i1.p1  ORF type:complete len:898 (-),score=170.40 TRINITY_DN39388_c0_g1_i1:70-2763(-)
MVQMLPRVVGLQGQVSPELTVTLPLCSVHVESLLVDRVAQHRIAQTYTNKHDLTIDVTYVFPLPENATVVEFDAIFSDARKIKGELRERREAEERFRMALRRGQRAALLEEERPDIFQTSVGKLAPGEMVTITLKYCQELPVEDDAVRLTIPSHVASRYTPQYDTMSAVLQNLAAQEAALNEAVLSTTVTCEMTQGIEIISSPTHPDAVVHLSQSSGKACVTFEDKGLDKDFVLIVKPLDIFQPILAWEEWEEKGTQALMLSLVPKFELPRLEKPELIFVVDCSGSMQGSRIQQAKRAMQFFLRSLPANCCFNIVKFGSTFDVMNETGSLPYSDESLEAAAANVSAIEANLGGTDILRPLEYIQKMSCTGKHMRQILLLTDGRVTNEQKVMDCMRDTDCRIFTLGVGSGVSTFMLRGLARISGGHAAFVQDHEKLEPTCISLLKKAMTPALANVKISWPSAPGDDFVLLNPSVHEAQTASLRDAGPSDKVISFFNPTPTDTKVLCPRQDQPSAGQSYQTAPIRPPPLHADANFCAFAFYPPGELLSGGEVQITGDSPSGRISFTIPLPSAARKRNEPVVHRMAARALINDFETGEISEALGSVGKWNTMQLSLTFSVLCKATAFVAVDQRDGSEHPAQVFDRTDGHERMGSLGGRSKGCVKKMAKASIFYGADEPPQGPLHLRNCLGGCLVCSISGACGMVAPKACLGGVVCGVCAFFAMRFPCAGITPSTRSGCSKGGSRPSAPKTHSLPAKENASRHVELQGVSQNASDPYNSSSYGSKMSQLEDLVCSFAADGSFSGGRQLLEQLSISEDDMTTWIKSERCMQSLSFKTLTTALALACLSTHFPDEKGSWELVAEKATVWLEGQAVEWGHDGFQDVEALVKASGCWLAKARRRE